MAASWGGMLFISSRWPPIYVALNIIDSAIEAPVVKASPSPLSMSQLVANNPMERLEVLDSAATLRQTAVKER